MQLLPYLKKGTIIPAIACSFTGNKVINVMHDQSGLAKLEISLNLRTALQSQENIAGTTVP